MPSISRLVDKPHLPRRTVRLRLTLLYGGLFVVSGAALLAITYLLVRHSTGDLLLVTRRAGQPTEIKRGLEALPDGTHLDRVARELRAQAREQRAEQLRQLLTQSGIALGLMAVVSIGLGWVMAGRVLRPVEEAFEAQRRFVANASHELRTPLAMMRTSLDVAAGKPGVAAPELEVLDGKLRQGLDRADRLVESFLTLARAEGAALPDQAIVSLPALVDEAIGGRAVAIAARDIDVRRELADADVSGSETLLAQLVANVVDNAVRHNEPSGWVRVATGVDGHVATVVVESGGPPLAKRDVEELARPFRRLGSERTENGVGLGLSIVSAIATAHGGRLDLRARPEGGLRVEVELPASRVRSGARVAVELPA